MAAADHNCDLHTGDLVRVGDYQVYAGGQWLSKEVLCDSSIVLSLCDQKPTWFDRLTDKPRRVRYSPFLVRAHETTQFMAFLQTEVLDPLKDGRRMAIHCQLGRERTGLMLAILITLLEPDVDDPVEAVRERYCPDALWDQQLIPLVFELKGQPVPDRYVPH